MARSSVTRLGELERAVMEHLWTNREAGGGSLTVREVHETVGTQRELAYTTVMTVLDRLAKKRLVIQERDGRAYRYSPISSREELTAQTMRETLGDLEARDRKGAMLHFLDDASPQEIDELKAALAEIERRSMTTSDSRSSSVGTRRFRRA
jgi:predicted transcriptional regulator